MRLHRWTLLWAIAATLAMNLGCSPAGRFADYRHEEPSEYYWLEPDAKEQGARLPLLLGLHDAGQDGAQCMADWSELAGDEPLYLLCPTLPSNEQGLDAASAEARLAEILNLVYGRYRLRERFFLAGSGAGARFGLAYALRYPRAVAGVVAVSPDGYPALPAGEGQVPLIILVDSHDEGARAEGQAFVEEAAGRGYAVRMISIRGLSGQVPFDAKRVTLDFLRQVMR